MTTPKNRNAMNAKKEEPNKSLAVIDHSVFDLEAISQGSAEIQDNLSEIQIILPQIKILHQAALYEMADGSKVESFEGIILDFNRIASYWPDAFESGTGVPPVCFSTDAVRPSPFSAELQSDFCATCEKNKPGSDPKGGRGRACKAKLRIHIVTDKHQLLPYRLVISAANLMPFNKFISSCVARGFPWRLLWVTFGLKTVKNSDGISYSEIDFKASGSIPPDQGAISKRLSESLMPLLRDMGKMSHEDE